MKWFTFRQNNSGGYYIDNDEVSYYICIQAANADEADKKANEIVDDHREYCECCGERWFIWSKDNGSEVPRIYDLPLFSGVNHAGISGNAVIYFADGKKIKMKVGQVVEF